jgi:hypothetical protein
MFGLFKPKTFRDKRLGDLRRSGHYWKGSLTLAPCGTFRLSLIGNREQPDQFSLRLAKASSERFSAQIPEIQRSLFEHYSPYAEAVAAGENTGSPCPNIAKPEDVWPYVTPAHILIEPLRGVWTVEVAFRTAWDVEHTVAARFQNWVLVELNGSV